jgi:glyoxylase-like metal-dependent hydrolase (beta-lactamase superfamily II)
MKQEIDRVIVGDIETNCWLYAPDAPETAGGRPCVVIDPGDEAGLIMERLGRLNWVPRRVFLTHGHLDHVAALPDLLEALAEAASGAPPETGIHRLDAGYLGKNSLRAHRDSFAAAGGDPAYVDALWKPLPDAGVLFEEGDTAGPFRILHLPGHTPGSVGLYDEKAGVLFSGDTLFRSGWGRVDLPGGDGARLRQSLKRLFLLDKHTVVCPGHGQPTTIGEEAARGPAF